MGPLQTYYITFKWYWKQKLESIWRTLYTTCDGKVPCIGRSDLHKRFSFVRIPWLKTARLNWKRQLFCVKQQTWFGVVNSNTLIIASMKNELTWHWCHWYAYRAKRIATDAYNLMTLTLVINTPTKAYFFNPDAGFNILPVTNVNVGLSMYMYLLYILT